MMLVVYGPTVTGKTDLAIKLAKKFNGELISADSRQIYKGLDIGTGKVNFKSKVEIRNGYWLVDGIKISGFDIVKPGNNYSAIDFASYTLKKIKEITNENKLPIIVGGSGFYIKILLEGAETAGIEPNIKLRKRLEKKSNQELLQLLSKLDPRIANKMNKSDRNNSRRLIRAIEVASGKKSKPRVKSQARTWGLATSDYLLLGLTAPNNVLYQKADSWLHKRLDKGLIDEVKSLRNQVSDEWLMDLGLEYRWVTKHLRKEMSKEDAINRLKGDIHSLIRRQKTYFNQFKNIKIFNVSAYNYQDQIEKTVHTWYNQKDGRS